VKPRRGHCASLLSALSIWHPGKGCKVSPPPDLVAFCRDEHARLVGTLTLYCGDREVAEELAQEVWVRVCSEWNKVRRLSSRRAWIYKIGTNLAHSYFRRKAAERRAFRRLEALEASKSRPAPAYSRGDDLMQSLEALPKRQRAALILRYYLDLSVGETADVLQCPEGTVKTLTRRGLRSLERTIDPEERTIRGVL
jgi:RNA polymerase sigma factor (sigma-70 family)